MASEATTWTDEEMETKELEDLLRRHRLEDEPRLLARLYDLYSRKYPVRPGRPKAGVAPRTTALQALSTLCCRGRRELRRLIKVGRATNEAYSLYKDGEINVLEAERLATMEGEELRRALDAIRISKADPAMPVIRALRRAVRAAGKVTLSGAAKAEVQRLIGELGGVVR